MQKVVPCYLDVRFENSALLIASLKSNTDLYG